MQRTTHASKHHKNAAKHHENAADHHRQAAKHHANGNFETAAHHAQAARGHTLEATQHADRASKQHAAFEGGMMEDSYEDSPRPSRGSESGFGNRSSQGGRYNEQDDDSDISSRSRSARSAGLDDEDDDESEYRDMPNGRSASMPSGARQQGQKSKGRNGSQTSTRA